MRYDSNETTSHQRQNEVELNNSFRSVYSLEDYVNLQNPCRYCKASLKLLHDKSKILQTRKATTKKKMKLLARQDCQTFYMIETINFKPHKSVSLNDNV